MQPPYPIALLIDNDPAFAYLIERYAQRSGYVVARAADVRTARVAIRHVRPVLALLNMLLPALASRTDALALKTDLADYDIPLVGYSAIVDHTRVRELGIDYYLLKPMLYDDFAFA